VFEIPSAILHPAQQHASPTPVIEQGRVYVHFGAHGTACLDTRSGKTIWARQDLPCNHFRGPASSPILYGNSLVVAFDGFDLQYVVALDKRTGQTLWRRDRNIEYGTDNGDVKKAYGTAKVITVDGAPQLVYPSAGADCLRAANRRVWRTNHGMNARNPPCSVTACCFQSFLAASPSPCVMQGRVTKTAVEWKAPGRADAFAGRPDLHGRDAALLRTDQDGVGLAKASGQFLALYAEGRVYFSNQEGQTFVVAARDYELLATNE
jgi:outer membrane protein assembly factor BamB